MLPPGTDGLPLLGETLDFAKNPFAFIETKFKQHGPVFRANVLGGNVAFFVGPEAFTAFVDPQNFTRDGASPGAIRRLLLWEAVPFLDGEAHKARKRALLQALGPQALPRYMPLIDKAIAACLQRIEGHEAVLADEFAGLAFAIADALFAGGDPATLNEPLRKSFGEFLGGLLSLPVNLPFTAYGRAMKARDTMAAYLDEAVARHKAKPQVDVMSALLDAGLDGEHVKIEALHFFFAGYAGMLAWLTWLFHAFATHPELEARCRTDAELLDRVCREVKRIYPVIPFTFFARALRDVQVGGVTVPKGWKALGCTYSTLHDSQSYADPAKFDPDRYLPPREEHKKRDNVFVPQGGGAVDGHRCAGEALADVLLKAMARQYLDGFTMEVPQQDLAIDWRASPPRPRSGLRATIRRRSR